MSNVIRFKKKSSSAEDWRFPDFTFDPDLAYEECHALYVGEQFRLSLAVVQGDGLTPLYLILHSGEGRDARCLQVWSPEEWFAIGPDVPIVLGLAVARALSHVEAIATASFSARTD